MDIVYPHVLEPGSVIGVVAPGSPPTDDIKVQRGIAWLESEGYTVVVGRSVSGRDGYLSGSDAVRASDIESMFANPDIDAVFCTRGGYGCTRLLSRIDYEVIRKNPKPFMGFSDITALHHAFLTCAGLVSYAGPMVAVEMQTPPSAFTKEMMDAVLKRESAIVEVVLPERNPTGYSRPGKARGQLIGGNLAVLTSILGTPYFPDPTGCVLFIEDVGEQVYRIDRMLSHLKNAGALDVLAGVMLGAFTAIPDVEPDRALSQVLQEYFQPLGIPVLDGLPFGHVPDKLTLPVGAMVEFDTESRILRMEMERISKDLC